MSTDTIIRVEGVSKKFCRSLKRTMLYGVRDIARDMFGVYQNSNSLRSDEFWALDDVSFEVERGECLGLIGPNGAGKSTLLKLLNGITLPDKGMIKVAGRVGALLELGAGFHPMLTGRENIYLNAAILGLSKEQIAGKFDTIVDFAGLEEFIDSPVKHYSSGMYVRLGFAIAAHADPHVFLIDEALAVGDISFQSNCYAKLREFRDRGVTIIFVTHNLDIVTTYCSRALLLHKGNVITDGAAKAVTDQYNKMVVIEKGNPCVRGDNVTMSGNSTLTSGEIEWKGLFNVNPNQDRYGTREAEILEAGIFAQDHTPVQTLQRGQEYRIKIKLRHNQSMPAPIVSFVVKESTGRTLCGTNTQFQDVAMGWMEKGTIVVVEFKHRVRLNPGEYLLSVGCEALRESGYATYDRRMDCFIFAVVGTGQRHGIFDPESVVSWESLQS
jgi:ABC-type polysaccharide/polyol phosphate transport system ATPase subunit